MRQNEELVFSQRLQLRLFHTLYIRFRISFFLLLFSVLFLYTPFTQMVVTVVYPEVDATRSDNNTSWANVSTDFQNGVKDTPSDTESWVANGTFMPTSGPNFTLSLASERSFHFFLKNDMSVFNDIAGTEPSRLERAPEANLTCQSCGISIPGETSANCLQVFFHNAS